MSNLFTEESLQLHTEYNTCHKKKSKRSPANFQSTSPTEEMWGNLQNFSWKILTITDIDRRTQHTFHDYLLAQISSRRTVERKIGAAKRAPEQKFKGREF